MKTPVQVFDLQETIRSSVLEVRGDGKAGGGLSSTRYEYKRSFAVAFCEGEVDALLKLWCDHKLVYNITGDNEKIAKQIGMGGGFKFYPGSETQMPDPVIEAQKGSGNVPAYRGTSYVVFNKLNLSRYGNRIPNIRALIGDASLVTFNTIKESSRVPWRRL